MKKLSLAYFGSPDFAANFLKKILLDKNLPLEVKLVITQPDQKVGRKQILSPTPVDIVALKYKVESLKIKNLNLNKNLKLKINNLDLCLVYAFGDLIPKELLSLPKYGFWNIHPSLLPKYRGPSPIATPLINGDKTTGVTIIKMDEEIDHGPIIAQESLTIKDTDYRPDLEKKLTDLGFEIFKKLIMKGEDTFFDEKNGVEFLVEQNHKEATFTKKLSKNDGFIEISKLKNQISKNSKELFNLFRGLTPWPGVWTLVKINELEKRLKITNLTMKQLNNLTVESVQLEGKTEVDFATFNKAYKIF